MTVAQNAVGINNSHHHRGVLPSLNAASLSVNQPRLWFGTASMRRSSAGGASDSKLVDVSAINCFLSLSNEILHQLHGILRCCKDRDNPAWPDSDCECARGTSCAVWSAIRPARYNCAVAPS